MISIIIPAYNEEQVIDRCLRSLLDGARPGELELIVACNGCTDRTSERARAFGPSVRVIEIERASKTAALNAADSVATGFPRIYVDADVVLPLGSVRKIATSLQRNGALLASPVAITETAHSSAPVRAFYDVFMRLPYNKVMVGTGVYALSKQGRERFGEFPSIISDDGYVRSRFAPHERIAVEDAAVKVYAPRTFSDCIRIKTRSRLGLYQLRSAYPHQDNADPKRPLAILRSLPWGIGLPWRVGVYLVVNVLTRVRAKRLLNNLESYDWQRDDASRNL